MVSRKTCIGRWQENGWLLESNVTSLSISGTHGRLIEKNNPTYGELFQGMASIARAIPGFRFLGPGGHRARRPLPRLN